MSYVTRLSNHSFVFYENLYVGLLRPAKKEPNLSLYIFMASEQMNTSLPDTRVAHRSRTYMGSPNVHPSTWTGLPSRPEPIK